MKPAGNLLEIEVCNVCANRIRDLDRRGVKWKNFHDINFVNIDYKPFDASDWPLAEAGLIGPVTLSRSQPWSFQNDPVHARESISCSVALAAFSLGAATARAAAVHSIADHGAVGNGKTLNTRAIRGTQT